MKYEHATCAQSIKKELKEKFPAIKFSVRSRSNAVEIEYDNSIPSQKIEDVVKKYEMGSFNGMDDLYQYNNRNDNLPQVKFVFVRRNISDDVYKQVENQIAKDYALENPEDENSWFKKFGFWKNSVVSRKISEMDLTPPDKLGNRTFEQLNEAGLI